MTGKHKANEVEIGYHPDGYRIDRTTSPINRYTKWTIQPDGKWKNMTPVCFDSLPRSGWIKVTAFAWGNAEWTWGPAKLSVEEGHPSGEV
jgi:hypothetical protein